MAARDTLFALLNRYYRAVHTGDGDPSTCIGWLKTALESDQAFLAAAQAHMAGLEALEAKCQGAGGRLAERDTVQAAHLAALRAALGGG